MAQVCNSNNGKMGGGDKRTLKVHGTVNLAYIAKSQTNERLCLK